MRPFRCWWFGCAPEPYDYLPPEYIQCRRCGNLINYSDVVGDTRACRTILRLRRWVQIVWPERCSDCGHKWTRCDETIDHLPF